MKITDIVINKINKFKSGYVFTYSDFNIQVDKVEALKKTLSRLVASGKIVRLSKGQFYKPEISQFGSLKPSEYQIVKDLLENDNKIIGYLTGIIAFNKLGLTTQISNTIQIGTNIDRKSKKRGRYNIRFIKQKNTITRDNIDVLQILDAIRFIKRIPDSNVSKTCLRLISIIKMLPKENLDQLIKYALKYNSGTRALTGAIVDQINETNITKPILESLNPVSEYKYNISWEVLNNKFKWRIS